jgi:hypothetical protein
MEEKISKIGADKAHLSSKYVKVHWFCDSQGSYMTFAFVNHLLNRADVLTVRLLWALPRQHLYAIEVNQDDRT